MRSSGYPVTSITSNQKRDREGAFVHKNYADDIADQLLRFSKASVRDRRLTLARLYDEAENADAKQQSAFRASFLTLIAVVVALLGLTFGPMIGQTMLAATSNASVTELRNKAEDALAKQVELNVEIRNQQPPGQGASDQQVALAQRLGISSQRAIDALYKAELAQVYSSAAALVAGLVLFGAVAMLGGVWASYNNRAMMLDRQRATAAAWIRLYKDEMDT